MCVLWSTWCGVGCSSGICLSLLQTHIASHIAVQQHCIPLREAGSEMGSIRISHPSPTHSLTPITTHQATWREQWDGRLLRLSYTECSVSEQHSFAYTASRQCLTGTSEDERDRRPCDHSHPRHAAFF